VPAELQAWVEKYPIQYMSGESYHHQWRGAKKKNGAIQRLRITVDLNKPLPTSQPTEADLVA
jgi:hypothetical protein